MSLLENMLRLGLVRSATYVIQTASAGRKLKRSARRERVKDLHQT